MELRKEAGKIANIWGVTGQDGSFLAEELLNLGYIVHGVKRRSSTNNLWRLKNVLDNPNFYLHVGDVCDYSSVNNIIGGCQPHYIYNLAAQSHVGTSFSEPFSSIDITLKGCLNILEVVKNILPTCKVYQASSSEMFGSSYSEREIQPIYYDNGFGQKTCKTVFPFPKEKFQDENTPMCPCSPYAVAKLACHNLIKIYRSGYGIFATSGILFNHESERRGEEFVTKKISQYVARLYNRSLKLGPYDTLNMEPLKLGNLNSVRDWGYARDYVKAMILMMQAQDPDDYVVATGDIHTVGEFLDAAFNYYNFKKDNYIEIDNSLIRPCEVSYLKGDSTRIRTKLGWEPTVNFNQLVEIMVTSDVAAL